MKKVFETMKSLAEDGYTNAKDGDAAAEFYGGEMLVWMVLVVVTVWWCAGGNMVIYQSALASIPQSHYEAAAVDGANAWQRFVHITIPGMKYPLTYTFIMSVIAQFNVYGQPLMLTGFNNNEANAVLLMYIQENAVKKQVAGMSAAMAVILGVCIMAVSYLQMRIMRANAPE